MILYYKGTWYYPGSSHLLYSFVKNKRINFVLGLGNCGYTDGNNDPVLAIGIGLYNRNGGSNCNQVTFFLPLLQSLLILLQWVSIVSNGNTAYGLTRDSCESCGDND